MRSRNASPARRALGALPLAVALISSVTGPRPLSTPLPLGCGPARPHAAPRAVAEGAWVGQGSAAEEPRAPASASAPPPVVAEPSPWELAPQLGSFRSATGRARSQHFTGELEAEVRVNPLAAPYPALGPERALPPGAALVEFHYEAGAAQPVTLLAMVKRHAGYDPEGGDWEYLILRPDGTSTHRGPLPLCKRCHADAPHDHLFGGPR